jgi:hypothetical protein
MHKFLDRLLIYVSDNPLQAIIVAAIIDTIVVASFVIWWMR